MKAKQVILHDSAYHTKHLLEVIIMLVLSRKLNQSIQIGD